MYTNNDNCNNKSSMRPSKYTIFINTSRSQTIYKSRCKYQMCLRTCNIRDGLLLPGKRRLWSANTFILKLANQDLLLFPKSRYFFYIVVIRFQPSLLDEEIYNEPVREISNNVVCATSKASDQPAHTRSQIRAFASCLSIL